MLLGHFLLGIGLFVMLFGVCWLALGPAFLLIAGAVDLTRAVDRALERRRVIETREARCEAGQLAIVAEPREGRISLPVPPRYTR